MLGRPCQTHRCAPVVQAQAHVRDAELVEQPVDERDVAGQGVVEVAALAAAAEAGQVDGDPAAERQDVGPVVRARRQSVQIQDRHSVVAGTPKEDGLAVELDRLLVRVWQGRGR